MAARSRSAELKTDLTVARRTNDPPRSQVVSPRGGSKQSWPPPLRESPLRPRVRCWGIGVGAIQDWRSRPPASTGRVHPPYSPQDPLGPPSQPPPRRVVPPSAPGNRHRATLPEKPGNITRRVWGASISCTTRRWGIVLLTQPTFAPHGKKLQHHHAPHALPFCTRPTVNIPITCTVRRGPLINGGARYHDISPIV